MTRVAALIRHVLTLMLAMTVLALPGWAQDGITVLDDAQDAAPQAAAAAGPCGSEPISIARMQWPSAAILAQIHATLLAEHFDCETEVVAGDLAATTSSMAATGQPAVAPELWVTRAADLWNQAIRAQSVRPAANSYAEERFEGWYVPDYASGLFPELSAAGLAAALPEGEAPLRFISCPADWGCAVINRNLLRAHGLSERVELVEPANRFEMDSEIAQAVSRRETFILYYWAPNAVLDQFGFAPLDMGAYDAEALRCLARVDCADPQPSAFAEETVVIALAEWVFTDIPEIASYFQRASLPLAEMNTLLARLNEPGATVETVAAWFVAEREAVWRPWVGNAPAPETGD